MPLKCTQDSDNVVPRRMNINGIHANANSYAHIAQFLAVADKRLATSREGEFAEIKAWRRAFSELGLKPTQYRCASESLLRRYRKSGELPTLHPMIDLCNAVSLAFAIPVAVFDIDQISGALTVRPACGDEFYETFSGRRNTLNPVKLSLPMIPVEPMPDAGLIGKAAGRPLSNVRPGC